MPDEMEENEWKLKLFEFSKYCIQYERLDPKIYLL